MASHKKDTKAIPSVQEDERRPYKAPHVVSDGVFETQALACANQFPLCTPASPS